MRIAQINMLPHGSTGKIMFQIADTAERQGHVVRTYSTVPFDMSDHVKPILRENHFVWGSESENKIHFYLGCLLGLNGLFSIKGTKALIRDLKSFGPDVVHLHNLHKFCINLPMLFRYLKKSNVRVVWTLHDCWAFTGHCPNFDMVKCERWKTGCGNCPQPKCYPKMLLDTSKLMYCLKKRWFSGVANMTLVTPSRWLAELTRESFLKGYPVQVINNGIDLAVFKPTPSNFREKHGIGEDTYILLGVAFGWGKRKGLDVLQELSKQLDGNYKIVLVGTDEYVDAQLPPEILSIHRTQNQKELAEIYSAANVLVNPTREDNYPTVNMEAIACGTPVITFQTGGSPEIVDANTGTIVDGNDLASLKREITRICVQQPYSEEACCKAAKDFDMYSKFREYVELYEKN